jgi:hypothetical protein
MPTLTVAGHSVTVGDEFLKLSPEEQNSAVDEIAKSLPEEKPSGVIDGLQHGIAQHIQGLGETAKDFAGLDNSGTNSAAAAIEPKDYKAAPIIRPGGHWYNPSDYTLSNIPQNLAEAAPGVGQDVLAGSTGAKIGAKLAGAKGAAIGGLGAGVVSALMRTLGPMAKSNAVARTGDENAEPNTADKTRAGVVGALEAPLNAVGLNRVLPGLGGKVVGVGVEGAGNALKKYLATVGTEAATGAARDAVDQVGSTAGTDKGIQFDPNRAATAAVTNAAGGALLAAPRVAGDIHQASKFREFGGDNAEAAAALANRQLAAADGKDLVGPLGGTKTAREAVASAHSDVHTELKAASKDQDLSTDNANTLKRINDGGSASKSELAALATEASPDVVHLARQALLSSKLKSMGDFNGDTFNGGLSGVMDKNLRPLYQPAGTLASAAAAVAGHAGGLGMIGMAAPHVLGTVYGTYAAARALDKVTGARSPAQGFTDKFGDPNVPIRTPAPAPVVPPPRTTSVPQVAPPQNTALWGNPTAPTPNLRATLNSNVKIDEGMAKIAKQLAAAKKASMISSAMPALQQLAATQGPNSPAANPAPAPTPAPAFNPNMMPRDITAPAKTIMNGLRNSAKAQSTYNIATQKADGIAQAEGLAADSHAINDQGGLNALRNPAFTSRASQLLGAANAMRKLTAQPPETETPAAKPEPPASPEIGALLNRLQTEHQPAAPAPAPAPAAPAMAGAPPTAPALPEAPMIAKITKKMGKVTAEPYSNAEQPFTPLPEEALWKKSLSDQQVADTQLADYNPALKKLYSKKIIETREGNRDSLESIANDHTTEDATVANRLYHELDHTHDAVRARKVIAHFKKLMSPEAAKAVDEHFTPSVISYRWKEPKAK